MTQIIVYTNENGNVSVCTPTEGVSIEDVLKKDCPEGAIVIDDNALPQNENEFFNAWRLVNGAISVDLDAAKSIILDRFNTFAAEEAGKRNQNTVIGIANVVSDADFLANLTAKRAAITAATSTAELRQIVV